MDKNISYEEFIDLVKKETMRCYKDIEEDRIEWAIKELYGLKSAYEGFKRTGDVHGAVWCIYMTV